MVWKIGLNHGSHQAEPLCKSLPDFNSKIKKEQSHGVEVKALIVKCQGTDSSIKLLVGDKAMLSQWRRLHYYFIGSQTTKTR